MANLIRKRHGAHSSVWRDADLTQLLEDLFTPAASTAAFVPSLELSESDDEYMISAELPGIGESDLDVQVDDNNVLTIRGEKKSEVHESRGGTEFSERSYGQFVRSIQLPPTVNASKIEASYENGVLQLRVPKMAETRARKIPIGSKEEKGEVKAMPSENVRAAEPTKEEAPPEPENQANDAPSSTTDGHAPQHH